MALKKTPFSFLSDINSNKNTENTKNERQISNITNSYDNVKDIEVPEFGNFKILKVLFRGLSSIIYLCEWVIDNNNVLFLSNYVNYINNDILSESIRIIETPTINLDTTEVGKRENTGICDAYNLEKKNTTDICNKKIIPLVLKLKHKGSHCKRCDIEQLREEIAIHKNLKHFNILQMLLCGEDENDIWVFFEYSSIGDLYSYIGFKTLEENQVKIIVSQILFSLYYLHVNGIIHCDIKPQNILLFSFESILFEIDNSLDIEILHNSKSIKLDINQLLNSANESNTFKYFIKLCDFGLSVKCEYDKFYSSRGIKGSYGFIAPEIYEGRDFNNKIDMWALGITVFILLGGYRPFCPVSRYEEKVTFHERYWHNISSEAKHFIQSLLQINPSKRLDVIEAIDHPW